MRQVDSGATSYPHAAPAHFRCHSRARTMVRDLCPAGAGLQCIARVGEERCQQRR